MSANAAPNVAYPVGPIAPPVDSSSIAPPGSDSQVPVVARALVTRPARTTQNRAATRTVFIEMCPFSEIAQIEAPEEYEGGRGFNHEGIHRVFEEDHRRPTSGNRRQNKGRTAHLGGVGAGRPPDVLGRDVQYV